MKRRIFIFVLAAVTVMSLCLSGCGEKEKVPEITETEITVYDGLLDEFYEMIASNGEVYYSDLSDGMAGVMEAAMEMEKADALSSIGYAIKDISGDGNPELVIGEIEEKTAEGYEGSNIYSVYTYAEDDIHCILEGWRRNSYSYMGDGSFLYRGSGGAMYYIFGTYTISEDGLTLECSDFYFTYEKDESFEEIGFYHNTSGQWDKSVSEELDITNEEFQQIEDDFVKDIKYIDLTPFSEYEYSGDGMNNECEAAQVCASWAEDIIDNYDEYDEFTADNYESQDKVLFTTDKSVKDFNILALTLEDVDDDGKVTFSEKSVYNMDTLKPERPLMVNMTLEGTIPNYGISYTDTDGSTKRYAVEISGKDGSLLLNEY